MLKIEDAPIKSGSSSPRSEEINTLVLHYTAADLQSSLQILRYRDVSVHYVVAENGAVYKLLENNRVGWHAGVSMWRGKKYVNARSIGIEIINLNGNKYAYPDPQIAALVELCQKIISENPLIKQRDVVGHSDVAPKRKSDPGKYFPWKVLAEHGIGLWPKPSNSTVIGSETQIQKMLQKCGYAPPHGYGVKGEVKVFVDNPDNPPAGVSGVVHVRPTDILRAFQLHYQPDNVTGVADQSTMQLLEGLIAVQ